MVGGIVLMIARCKLRRLFTKSTKWVAIFSSWHYLIIYFGGECVRLMAHILTDVQQNMVAFGIIPYRPSQRSTSIFDLIQFAPLLSFSNDFVIFQLANRYNQSRLQVGGSNKDQYMLSPFGM